MIKPKIVKDEHLVYLDNLRISGETNMFAAGEYIRRKFNVSTSDALEILTYWMKTFTERHKEDKK